ncbi:hypothetical protein N657DRAFT_22885 [Parathielavia appendiculata]|uniref:Uncharacterized protein n=1 Tax=Parathielavia appendiculata TaxID=2587402 RepID=A0AAN6U8K0_9PEZI|nr:hypothetical protein N657DRAFT_22885 [Parathielavia appendiculata]
MVGQANECDVFRNSEIRSTSLITWYFAVLHAAKRHKFSTRIKRIINSFRIIRTFPRLRQYVFHLELTHTPFLDSCYSRCLITVTLTRSFLQKFQNQQPSSVPFAFSFPGSALCHNDFHLSRAFDSSSVFLRNFRPVSTPSSVTPGLSIGFFATRGTFDLFCTHRVETK